jgi:hypothetical protein
MSRVGSAQGSFSISFESLEFAQDVRVAEGVIDPVHPAIRQEMVMHDDAPPCKSLGCRRAFRPRDRR